VLAHLSNEGRQLKPTDIIAVTEGIVAKAEGNFATIDQLAADVREKFGDAEIGLVYPILSRNRFLNILKGIAQGAKRLHILLSYPHDEVGNPIMDITHLDDTIDRLQNRMVTAAEFRAAAGEFVHTFTGVDYIDLYESVGPHVSVYFSNDPRDILKLTPYVCVTEIHNRFNTKARLLKAGAKTVYTLSDLLNRSVNGSGYNSEYGVLGSNLSTENTLKLFPNQAPAFVQTVQNLLKERTGVAPEVMVYGDGAFKDPVCGIWELADPVVSPGHTPLLAGRPSEIKLKLVADQAFGTLRGEEQRVAVTEAVRRKHNDPLAFREGTTPRVYADLLGSLCDLMSGSGDKGTPVIFISGYFDDYATE